MYDVKQFGKWTRCPEQVVWVGGWVSDRWRVVIKVCWLEPVNGNCIFLAIDINGVVFIHSFHD